MKSHITASIEFYFKGEKFAFSSDIDIADWFRDHQCDTEALYDMLAAQNGLDRYRHEYDVMVMEPIQFSQATGLAAEYLCHGEFDIDNFLSAREQKAITSLLQAIAKEHLDIECLEKHPKLQAALLAAYSANKK